MKEAGGEGEEVSSCSTEDWSRFEEPGSQLRSFLDGLQIFIQDLTLTLTQHCSG